MTKDTPNRFGPVAFDTLKVYEDLMEAGLEQDAARAVTEAMTRAHLHRGATVADLREVEHRLEKQLLDLDRKLEVQETRNRVGLSAIRKEGADIRKGIVQGFTRLSWTLAALFALAVVLVQLMPHLPGYPWSDHLFRQEPASVGIGFQSILPGFWNVDGM